MSSIGSPTVNRIILGDNLEILRGMPDESVDLIYLDPPFFSNRDYEVIWGDEGEIRSFKDRWAGGSQGVQVYIDWLKERIQEMYRVLKKTGSFYLHCDWHASHNIKVDILDQHELFGRKNFRNEIIWKRTNAKSNSTKRFAVNTDSIFFYTKSAQYTLNQLRGDYSREQLSRYKQQDDNGVYRCENLTAPGQARQFVWRGVHPGKNRSWCYSEERLEELLQQGLVVLQRNGRPRKDGLKRYLSDAQGELLDNLWDDIERVGNTSKERIGYPTQKPEALLERIIQCASNPGDVVLDPFVGGGTTIAVADKLGRQWIGIDQSVAAIKVSELRLNKQQDLLSVPFSVQLHKYDYDRLRTMDAISFQDWIIEQYGGRSNPVKGGELGVDGWMPDGTIIQVKRSDKVDRIEIDKFFSALQRKDKKLYIKNKTEKKPVGHFIAFSYGKGAIEEVARLKTKEGIIIKLLTVEDIVPLAKKPKIKTVFKVLSTNAFGQREIELTATGESDAGVEFYSWDFSFDEKDGFKADVVRDPNGKQIRNLGVGTHHIAVKVIDNEGLESIEVVPLHINGGVKRKG